MAEEDMEFGIRASSLKLLGRYYGNDPLLDVVESDVSVTLVPPRNWKKSLSRITFTLAVLATLLCGAAAWGLSILVNQSFTWRLITYSFIILVWCLAVVGPHVGFTLRMRYLESLSPLLAYNRESHDVSIHAHSASWRQEEIMAILGLSSFDSSGESKAELQVLVKEDDRVNQHLVATSNFNRVDDIFLNQIKTFCTLTGIPGCIVDHRKKNNLIVATVRSVGSADQQTNQLKPCSPPACY